MNDPGTDADGAAGSTPRSSDDGSDEKTEPTAPTYGWTPEGEACAGCGARVETRWRENDEWVCPDCKEW